MEPFALALACGEADFKVSHFLVNQCAAIIFTDSNDWQMYSGVIVIDGNRIRFSVDDWQVMLAIKKLRQTLRLILAEIFRHPGYRLPPQQQKWMDIWEKIFAYHDESTAAAKK